MRKKNSLYMEKNINIKSKYSLKVFLIANNVYGEGLNNLRGAEFVIEQLYEYFVQHVVSNPESDVIMLRGENNTEALTKLYSFIDRNINCNDIFLFYFCGHGKVSAKRPNELMLSVKDTSLDNIDVIGIDFNKLVDECANKNVKRAIYILDCCNSGVMHKSSTGNINDTVFISAVKGTSKTLECEFEGRKVPLFSYCLLRAFQKNNNESWYSIREIFEKTIEYINEFKNPRIIEPQISCSKNLESEKIFPNINLSFSDNNLLDVIDWRITTKCNNQCQVCYACNDKKQIEDLSESKIDIILDKLTLLQCKSICISGGEPTSSENLTRILEKLDQKGFSIFLSTNGYKYLENRIQIEKYIDKLSLPIDGYEEDNIVNGRNNESFKQVKEILEIYKKKQPKFPIKISTVFTSKIKNISNHLTKIFEFLKNYNIAIWKIYEFIPENRGVQYKNEFMPLVSHKNEVTQWISKFSKDCNFKIEFVRRDKRNAAYFIIQPDGRVIIPIEENDYVKEIEVGDILKDEIDIIINKWSQYVNKDNYFFNIRLRKIMQTYFLDNIDRNILFEICSRDTFPSLEYLSKILCEDISNIKEHLDELYEHRIIKRIIPIVNLKIFGIKTFLVTLNLLEYINYPKGYLEDYLCYNAHIGWVTECENNIYRIAIFEKEIKNAIKVLGKMQIDLNYRFDYEINELICSYNFGEKNLFTSELKKSYSTAKYNSNEQKIMKDVKLNSTEFYVLKQIEELRKPCKENIDEKIFLNNINVFDNVNTLINKGIIEHLSILLDTRLIVIFVQLQENQIDNLIRYLEDSSINVTHVNYMISNNSKWNLDFEVHSLSNAELEVLIDQIQRKFNALITTKKIKIIKECKFSFLTHYVLDIIKTKYLLND